MQFALEKKRSCHLVPKKVCGSGKEKKVHHTNDARMHTFYMLCSTAKKSTQHFCVIPYVMYLSNCINDTNAD